MYVNGTAGAVVVMAVRRADLQAEGVKRADKGPNGDSLSDDDDDDNRKKGRQTLKGGRSES